MDCKAVIIDNHFAWICYSAHHMVYEAVQKLAPSVLISLPENLTSD